jgi:hypothetical protein
LAPATATIHHPHQEHTMELIVTLLVAFPIGYFVRDRLVAVLAYIAVHSFVFSFQAMQLTREWVGGSTEAFSKNPGTVPWAYFVVNLVIYAAGFGLVLLGARLATRRRRHHADAVELTA